MRQLLVRQLGEAHQAGLLAQGLDAAQRGSDLGEPAAVDDAGCGGTTSVDDEADDAPEAAHLRRGDGVRAVARQPRIKDLLHARLTGELLGERLCCAVLAIDPEPERLDATTDQETRMRV